MQFKNYSKLAFNMYLSNTFVPSSKWRTLIFFFLRIGANNILLFLYSSPTFPPPRYQNECLEVNPYLEGTRKKASNLILQLRFVTHYYSHFIAYKLRSTCLGAQSFVQLRSEISPPGALCSYTQAVKSVGLRPGCTIESPKELSEENTAARPPPSSTQPITVSISEGGAWAEIFFLKLPR